MGGSRGDISETPGCFELENGELSHLDELDEFGDAVGVDRVLDGRVFLVGEEFSHADAAAVLMEDVLTVEVHD